MGNKAHMDMALRGVADWNAWRAAHLDVQPDLTRIDLSGRDLRGIDLRGVGLFKANLSETNLAGANLRQSIMIGTNLRSADMRGAHVYGASVWDVQVDDAVQLDLVITAPGQPAITTDSLQMAQFLYLLLNNENLRDAIETLTTRVVLILGRFTAPRKPVLETIKTGLRTAGLVPVLFDFEGPETRTLTDTVKTIALLAKATVIDLTDPQSSPWELAAVSDAARTLRIVPILERGARPFAMFDDVVTQHPNTLPPEYYDDLGDVAARLVPRLVGLINLP